MDYESMLKEWRKKSFYNDVPVELGSGEISDRNDGDARDGDAGAYPQGNAAVAVDSCQPQDVENQVRGDEVPGYTGDHDSSQAGNGQSDGKVSGDHHGQPASGNEAAKFLRGNVADAWPVQTSCDVRPSLPIAAIMVGVQSIVYADLRDERNVHRFDAQNPDNRGTLWKPNGFYRPTSLAVSPDGKRFAVRDDEGIHLFCSWSMNYIASTPSSQDSRFRFGVAAMPDGRFVTVDDRKKRLLFVDAHTGAIEDEKQLPIGRVFRNDGVSRLRFIWADAHGKNGSTRIALVDFGHHRVFVVDPQGQPLYDFGGYGKEYGKFDSPAGMIALHNGDFIVADSNNARYQVFDPVGTFKSTFPVEFGLSRLKAKGLAIPWGRLVGMSMKEPVTRSASLPCPYAGIHVVTTTFDPPLIILLTLLET